MAVQDSPISKLTQATAIHTKKENRNLSADLLLISQLNTSNKYESKGIDYNSAVTSIMGTATGELSSQLIDFIHNNSCVTLCRWKRVTA